MKKIILSFLIIATITAVANAQKDPGAKKILENVSAKLKSFKGVSAQFIYTTKDKKNVKRGSVNGSIDFKGQKYHIKQGSNEIFCNGSKIWNFNSDNNEVTVASVDNDAQTLSPQRLLSSESYDKDFSYKLVTSNGEFHQIQLSPTDNRKSFKQVTLYINKAKSIVTKATVLDKSDNTIDFSLNNVNTNASIPDARFEFNAKNHPGVEIITE